MLHIVFEKTYGGELCTSTYDILNCKILKKNEAMCHYNWRILKYCFLLDTIYGKKIM